MTDETNAGNPVESQGVPVENDDDAGTDEPEGAEGTAPDDQAASNRLAEGSPTPESITTAPADQVEGEGAAPAPEVQPEAQPVRHEGVVPGTEPDKE